MSTRKFERLTGSFEAIDDNGGRHVIKIWTHCLETNLLDGGTAVVEGLKSLRTASGESVSPRGPGEWEIVMRGVRLTSTDPNAPV